MSAPLVVAQSLAALPAHDAWLAPAERARAAALIGPARRRDYRLGRWTAKRALARFLGAEEDAAALGALEVRGAAKEPPVAWWRGAPAPCALSLSHRGSAAIAAVAGAGFRIGCDLERSEPRSDAFVAQFFGAAERTWFASLPEPLRTRAVALAWSAKESALKALGTGLDRDTRELRVTIAGAADGARWQPLRVAVAGRADMHGSWCRRGAWLVTVVADPAPPTPRWVAAGARRVEAA